LDVRLLGDERSVTGLADALEQMGGVEVLRRTGPRINRHDPGVRIYLTVRMHDERAAGENADA
jgi:hypothetical protein